MSHGFEPYYQWLGIPPEDQPPNHYRLLGIPLFESRREVIQNASDQRMAHLKARATGRDSDLSERLLNEVSAATVCLLSSREKQAYDARLHSQLASVLKEPNGQRSTHAPRVPPTGQPPPAPVNEPKSPEQFEPRFRATGASVRSRVQRGKQEHRKRQSLLALTIQILLTGVIGLAAGCFVLWLINPHHPIIKSLERVVRSPDPPPQSEAPSRRDVTREQARKMPRSTDKVEQPKASEPSHAGPVPVASQPVERRPFERAQPPLQPTVTPSVPALHAPQPIVTKTTTLDLSKRFVYVTLPEVTDVRRTRIEVGEITGLATPFRLLPQKGIIRHQQPVDLEFTLYEGVKVTLSLEKPGTLVRLKASPLIERQRGPAVSFRSQWVQQNGKSLATTAAKWEQQVVAAETEIRTITTWLASPVSKPLAVRSARRTQLAYLEGEIPGWTQTAMQARREVEEFKRLAGLANELHKTTKIQFAVYLDAQELPTANDPPGPDETISREGGPDQSSPWDAGQEPPGSDATGERLASQAPPTNEQPRKPADPLEATGPSREETPAIQPRTELPPALAAIRTFLRQRDVLGARARWVRTRALADDQERATNQPGLFLLHCYECFWEGVSQSLEQSPPPRELQVGTANYVLLTELDQKSQTLTVKQHGRLHRYAVKTFDLPAEGELESAELVVISEMPAAWLHAVFADHSYLEPGLHELYEAAFLLGEGRDDVAMRLLVEARRGALDTETGRWVREAASALQSTMAAQNGNLP